MNWSGDYSPAASNWVSSVDGYIGNTSNGTMTVNGGYIVSSQNGYVGYGSPFGTSVATISGAGSLWQNSAGVNVGYNGTGLVTVNGGASVTSTSCASAPELVWARSILTGAGSKWIGSGNVNVGAGSGQGTLNITNGGVLTVTATDSNQRHRLYYTFHYRFLRHGNRRRPGLGLEQQRPGIEFLFVGTDDGTNGTSFGLLNITNGGAVSAGTTTTTIVGATQSYINFGANGGTLNSQTLIANAQALKGTGKINVNGIVTDGNNILFDGAGTATHGLNQTFAMVNGSGTVSVNLNLSNTAANGTLGAGDTGSGTLTITNGISVYSASGNLGYATTGNGLAVVNGTGSKWSLATALYGRHDGRLHGHRHGDRYQRRHRQQLQGLAGPIPWLKRQRVGHGQQFHVDHRRRRHGSRVGGQRNIYSVQRRFRQQRWHGLNIAENAGSYGTIREWNLYLHQHQQQQLRRRLRRHGHPEHWQQQPRWQHFLHCLRRLLPPAAPPARSASRVGRSTQSPSW